MTDKTSSKMNPHWLTHWPKTMRTNANPFTSDAFLTAVETTDVCSAQTGWTPQHLKLTDTLIIPAYLKSHSWGEYVFDWAWANAYEQNGLDYYPKLVIAAPYTPSMGPRLLGARHKQDAANAVDAFKQKVMADELSGFHILFPAREEQAWLNDLNLHKRTDVQFHWQNINYRDFDDFLDRFSSRKRKNVRKERQSIEQQGLTMTTLEGDEINAQSWHAFYQFYHATYLKRGRHGYLTKVFFDALLASLRQNLVLIVASKDSHLVASALFFKDDECLYGRYWGCFEEFNNLHFETCYYQGIDYCIRNGLKRFDPGTQGEHKIARGFEPTFTHSYHWLRHPEFNAAVQRFCLEETSAVLEYYNQAKKALPFKETPN